jgi:DNA-binding NarL/FixJ family response regulator
MGVVSLARQARQGGGALMALPRFVDGARAIAPSRRAVWALVAQGAGNKDIARERRLTIKTVEVYISDLCSALECANRTELALLYYDHPRYSHRSP